ncbi:putative Mitochondrial inner membrane translocase complex, subunit Tim17/22 protein [Pseudoloma neurophilia]|uniref:Mitochondrial import inner membrane translocase subunit TIM22 n=1 Tax=Pseudoloma neurophilia TaxID=146866 RepID=A0A0R0M0B8_9MICR|nr:putative Mitochondrial inner membrane translocase complex, subunit Tim17/22 protein [Pseudoloma neurophilia]
MFFKKDPPKLEPKINKTDKTETFFTRINPVLKNMAINGAKGYVFGSFVGLINSRESVDETISDIHRSGLKFMSLGMVYTGAESIIETIREKKCVYNSIGASAIAGGVILGRQSLKKGIMGAVGFSLYTGLNNFPIELQDPESEIQ